MLTYLCHPWPSAWDKRNILDFPVKKIIMTIRGNKSRKKLFYLFSLVIFIE